LRVYISVDIEGVAGVSTIDQITRGGTGYPAAARLMTAEANAAIDGAFDAGASAVTVNDSHGTMDNLSPTELDSRARLISGTPKAQSMAQGLSPDFDAALLIGYHGAAGSRGVLAHTVTSHFAHMRLDGISVSEADIVALYAATLGVPVAFISGDDVICADANRLMPRATKVAVKESIGWSAANSLHPTESALAIRTGVRESLRDIGVLTMPPVDAPWEFHVEMQQPMAAELAASVPGAVLVSPTGVQRTVQDPSELIGLITVWSALAGTAALARLPMLQRR
jgi:D-amino peptidase